MFTESELKSTKAIVNIYETGDPIGHYDKLVVLGDGAGITFGKTQTTENSGGLWKLIFEEYADLSGMFLSAFLPFKEKLFRKNGHGEKFALTEDKEFKTLLVSAAKKDPAMRKAQDRYFHRNYFRPALEIADEFEVSLPLGLVIIYDMCIHSGPKRAKRLINTFNNGWSEPEGLQLPENDDDLTEEQELQLEKSWIEDLIHDRDEWLRYFKGNTEAHTQVVRKSVYRTESMLDLVERDQWDLNIPLQVKLFTRTKEITKNVLKEVW